MSLDQHNAHISEHQANGLLLGELDATTRGALQAHLDGCVQCRDYLEVLEARDEQLRQMAVPRWLKMAPALTQTPEEPSEENPEETPEEPPRRASRPGAGRGWLGLVVAAAAVVLMAWLLVPILQTESPEPHDDIRRKQGGVGFEVYVDAVKGGRLLASGDPVHPGDRVGFRVHPDRPGFMMIAGRDSAGGVYLCYPQSGVSQPIKPSGQGQVVAQAMELDDVPGFEQFILTVCPEPFSFREFEGHLKQAAPISPLRRLPTWREGCEQREVVLRKSDQR